MPRLLPLLLLVIALGTTACGQAVGNPGVAAWVDGEAIPVSLIEERFLEVTASPAYDQLLAEQEPLEAERLVAGSILGRFIQAELFEQALIERDLPVPTDEEVQAELDIIIEEQFGGQEAFDEQVVVGQGNSPESILEQVRLGMMIQRIQEQVVADVEVTDADVQAVYDSQYGQPNVAHILTETEEDAAAARERIEAGETFAAVAMEVSTDPGSAPQGGDLGPFQPGSFPPPLEQAILGLQPGDVSQPVQSEFGWHLLTISEPPPLDDELRAQLEETARQQASQRAMEDLQAEVLFSGDVEVNPRFGTWDALQRVVVYADPLGQLQAADPAAAAPLDPNAPALPPPPSS